MLINPHAFLIGREAILSGVPPLELGALAAVLARPPLNRHLLRRLRRISHRMRVSKRDFRAGLYVIGTHGSEGITRGLKGTSRCEDGLLAREDGSLELFTYAPIPYLEFGPDGAIRRINNAASELLKCSPEQLLGRKIWEFSDPDGEKRHREATLKSIGSSAQPEPFECEYVLDDGSRFVVQVRDIVFRDECGVVTGACRSVFDITERHLASIATDRAERYAIELRNRNEQLVGALEAARASAAVKGRLLAAVSHELRTPLNGIIGFAEILHDGRLGRLTDPQRDVLGDVLSSARHLLRLINDLLDVSKIDAGKMQFRPEQVELGALANEVCDVLRPLADANEIRLILAVSRGLTAVTDPARLKQVLYNYLSNAVKFTPQGGRITLRIGREGEDMFCVEVEDTGMGIAPEEIPELFQEFRQLPAGVKSDQGTGLGLALTRRIVEAQGGRVAVRSEPGRGSVFSAVLPLAPMSTRHSG